MSLKFATAVYSSILLMGVGFAQEAEKSTAQYGQKSDSQKKSSGKTKHHTMKGTVGSYEAGKSIQVNGKNGMTHKYDLSSSDATYTVSPDISAGSQVRLTEDADADGKKTVVIEPAGKSSGSAGKMDKTGRKDKSDRKPMSEKPPVPLPQ